MNALLKNMEKAKAPVRKTGREASAREMLDRVKDRFPKVMQRLGE